jgi:hypothetical protein
MILAYSVALPGPSRLPEFVSVLQCHRIQCFYGERETPINDTNVKDEALRYFEVNRRIFSQIDILEFRFPTLLSSVGELSTHLEQIQNKLFEELQRLKGLSQFTIYLLAQVPASKESASGTEYLQRKLEAGRIRQARVDELARLAGARQSLLDGDRAHLLVPREEVMRVIDELSDLRDINVAGPFPPSSFAKLLS